MSTSNRRHRSPAFRPASEALEGRQLLAQVIRGVDVDGDTYVLRLLGAGDVAVINQNGPDGTPVPLGQPAQIRSITLGGALPTSTRLIGAVNRAPGGDGRIFFQSLSEAPSTPPAAGIGVGTLAVDIPGFYLAATDPTSTAATAGSIDFADGIVTLRFGGVDTTAFGLNANNRSDRFTINLGLPTRIGTSVIVDRIVTANQPAVGTGQPTQDTVALNVEGRLNLFQANTIEGDPTLNLGETGRFEGDNPGGTTITSAPAGTDFLGSIPGFIGRFRVGGNATNLAVNVNGGGGTDASITNLSIGGETNKVSINAETNLRTAQFGLGMDTVAIRAERIQFLGANRGAVGSSIVTQRDAGLLNFGGDVVDTRVLSGYATGSDGEPAAQELGSMTVLVAGDVTDSVFAASVEPNEDMTFGGVDDLRNLAGMIDAKVEGTIDNSLNPEVDPDVADQAFFARHLTVARGPIVPPGSEAPPYRPTDGPGRTPGVRGIGGGPRGHAFRFVRNLANPRRNRPTA